MNKTDIVLVQMPFGTLSTPSLGLSLLKAELAARGYSVRVLYFTFPFAKWIGSDFYYKMSNQDPRPTAQLGEWIFSAALFGYPSDEKAAAYFRDALPEKLQADQAFLTKVRAVQKESITYADWCANQILSLQPAIVGFGTTFQQNTASLAVARRIKALSRETRVIFGGANCDGPMGAEMARSFPFLDATVSGEGDLVLPELVKRMMAREPFADVQGVYTPETGDIALRENKLRPPATVTDMDSLPMADYSDFFDGLNQAKIDPPIQAKVLFETSRGCWWGEINHCTFCGLNGQTMTFRSKSPERALQEVLYLARTYPGCQLGAMDNILDMHYFKEFLPGLAASGIKLDLFYEIKPNLKKEQVELMSRAGFTSVQPGLENLSSKVLEQMKKGVKAIQNVQLLKWCKEYGIFVYWNLLWGFPNEEAEEYRKTAELMPWLTHLTPPSGSGQVRLDRFSPHFMRSQDFGFANVRPYPGYFHVYPFDAERVANLTYFFTFDWPEPRSTDYLLPAAEQVHRWREVHKSSDLFMVDTNGSLLIWDLRPAARSPLTVLKGLPRRLYLQCDSISSSLQLKQLAEEILNTPCTTAEIDRLIAPLVTAGLLMRENHSYLSLAIPVGVYQPSVQVKQRFLNVLRRLGGSIKDGAVVIPTRAA